MYKLRNKFRFYLLPENAVSLLSFICFVFGIMCVPISALLMLYDFPQNVQNKEYSNQLLAVFLGLWAINLVSIANFLKKR